MNNDRKSPFCLNCNHPLGEEDDFCPICGQENKTQKVSLNVLLNDFFSNYLNFDSALFRTIPVFLTQPGKLTIVFNEGKRKKYIHPIRLYLILSLFYFFIVGIIIPPNIFDRILTNATLNEGGSNLVQFQDSPTDSDHKLNQALEGNYLMQIDSIEQIKISPKIDSTTKRNPWLELKLAAQDPYLPDSLFRELFNTSSYGFKSSLDTKNIRNLIANSNIYVINSAKNLPIMMFVLLPFFALLLKILYLNTSTFYVEHLINGLHIHSFAYAIYGLGLLLLNYQFGNLELIWSICFIIVSTYSYFTLIKIHQQDWFVTLIKFWALGLVYFTLLLLSIGAELYVSLLML